MSEATQILVAFLSVVGVGLGSWATYRASVRGKLIESEAAPYDQLRQRVGELESEAAEISRRLRSLERRFRIVSDALLEQHQWQLDGATPPPPSIPPMAIAIITREDTDHDH